MKTIWFNFNSRLMQLELDRNQPKHILRIIWKNSEIVHILFFKNIDLFLIPRWIKKTHSSWIESSEICCSRWCWVNSKFYYEKHIFFFSLTSKSVEISYVGPNKPFRLLTTEEVESALKDLENVIIIFE